MRTLSRETARVLDDLGDAVGGFIVTRDGVPFARLVALSPVEREFHKELARRGLEPDLAPTVRDDLAPLSPDANGGPPASSLLLEDRASYYREP